MHARGDMMPKPLNLTDMLWQKSEARAERAPEKAKLARPAAPRTQGEFMPEAPAPGDKANKAEKADRAHQAGPKPFAERVKESQARLSGKNHAFFKQPARPEAQRSQADRGEARSEAARAESKPADSRDSGDSRETGNVEKTPAKNGSARSEAAHARNQARKAARNEQPEAPAETWTPGESRPISLEAVESEGAGGLGGWEDADLENGAMDFDALQARLEGLGMEVTPEQLRDPAFLAEMLWMIDGLPMATPLFPEAQPLESDLLAAAAPEAAAGAAAPVGTAGLPAEDALAAAPVLATGGEAAAAAAVPAETFDWTAVEEPEREEIAALLRDKLGALADKSEFKAGPAAAPLASTAAAAGLPEAFQALRGEARLDMNLPKADVALADPDRLRVLQSAGLNALGGLQAPENNVLRVDAEGMDMDAPEAALDLDPMAPVSHANAKGGKQGESLPDLLGRNPGQAGENAAPREALASKDAPASPSAFQTALDPVRASEIRPAQAREPGLPSAQIHEQTVLAQIARKMSALGLRGTEEIRIQLEPEHLGRVRIALEMRDGGLTARIGVENDSVRQIVDANMAGLRTSLEDQGIKIQGMEVSVDHRHASLFNPDGSNAREFFRQRGQGGFSGEGRADTEEPAETDTGRRMGYNTLEFIA